VSSRLYVLYLTRSIATGGMAVVTARALGASGRGALVLMLTVATFVSVLCAMGSNAAARVLLVRGSRDERVELAEYVGLSMALSLLAAVCAFACTFVLLPLTGVGGGWSAAVLTGGYSGLFLLGRQLADGLHAFGRHVDAGMTATAPSLAALLVAVALAAGGDEAELHYLAILTAAAASQVVLTYNFLGVRAHDLVQQRRSAWRRLLRTGSPGMGLELSEALTFRLDRYLVGVFLSPAAVGIYSVAATLPEFLRLFPYSVSQIVFRRAATEPRYAAEHFPRIRLRAVLLVAIAALLVAITAPWLVPAVFGQEFRSAVLPLLILLVAEVAIASFHLDSACLAGSARLRAAAGAALVGLTVVVLGDLLLIPRFGLQGAAWASVLAYSAMALRARRALRQGPTPMVSRS
jgi:O-antigen/teichoic acid export membrane protein